MIGIFTDGCSKRAQMVGPSGCAAIIVWEYAGHTSRAQRHPIYRFLGPQIDNNFAELSGIQDGLEYVLSEYGERWRRGLHTSNRVVVFTDSQYAIGEIMSGEPPKRFHDLVMSCRKLASQFDDLRFEWIKGHNGHPLNELADAYANLAVREWLADQHLKS